jgi:hypothetical protein
MVMVVPAAAVPAVKVAVATPSALVVPETTTSVPAEAVNAIVAPEIALLPSLRAVAEMVAVVLPSEAIVVGLAVKVMEVTSEPPPLLLLLLELLELELLLECAVIELPPQAESSQAAATAMIDNLCMSWNPRRTAPICGSD